MYIYMCMYDGADDVHTSRRGTSECQCVCVACLRTYVRVAAMGNALGIYWFVYIGMADTARCALRSCMTLSSLP